MGENVTLKDYPGSKLLTLDIETVRMIAKEAATETVKAFRPEVTSEIKDAIKTHDIESELKHAKKFMKIFMFFITPAYVALIYAAVRYFTGI